MELQFDCDCMEEHCRVGAFEVSEVWAGREQDLVIRIDLWRCMECRRHWLRYSQVDEQSPSYGKWYRGAIEAGEAAELTEEVAKNLLAAMPWHFYGGPYYRTSGEFANGPIPVTGSELKQVARAA
jgi:hypothetical protein